MRRARKHLWPAAAVSTRVRRCTPVLVAAVAAFALFSTQVAFAHSGEPRLESGSERVSPGAPLTVRGFAFAYEEAVALSLVGGNQTIRLGTATTDVEGGFTQTLILSAGLAEGTYSVQAADGHHVVNGPPVIVSGALVTAGEDGDGRREEEDSLLAPMPSSPGTTAAATSSAGTPAGSNRDWKAILVVVVAISILVGAVGIRGLKQR